MKKGELFKRVFGFEFVLSIPCEAITCADCPYHNEPYCDEYSDRERGIDWAEMEMR